MYLPEAKLYVGSLAEKKKKKEKDEICFKTLSVQILESRIQGVIVDMHIDEALQKRKQFKVRCMNIFLSQSTDTNIMKQTKGLRSVLLFCSPNTFDRKEY